MDLTPGSLLGGKYLVERVVGEGGMGRVLLARHTLLDQSVAIKVIHERLLAEPSARQRLLREARVLAKLRGTHVARILDVVADEAGPTFLVLEHLEGEDLERLLERSGPLPVNEAVRYLIEACEALAEAHTQGIVHRDVKPSNLFLAKQPDGSRIVKVLDFGISKLSSEAEAPSLTRTDVAIGSPLYMAPEQMRSGRAVDARADVWALGAVLYELISGQPPFVGESLVELCAAILESGAPSLAAARADVPRELDAVVRRCLDRDPAVRFPTAAELGAALASLGSAELRGAALAAAPTLSSAATQPSSPGVSAELLGPETVASTATRAAVFQGTTGQSVTLQARTRPSTDSGRRAAWVVAGAVAIALLAVGNVAIRASGATRSESTAEAAKNVGAASAQPSEFPSAASAPLHARPVVSPSATASLATASPVLPPRGPQPTASAALTRSSSVGAPASRARGDTTPRTGAAPPLPASGGEAEYEQRAGF
jgi:serine/threonine-protein kinase